MTKLHYLCSTKLIFLVRMDFKETDIEGVYIVEPKVSVDFIQDNESKSSYGVLRGLHYQKGEFSQAKLVRVIKGCVLDVAVDIRKSSPTFGKHVMVELSDENKRQFFIPRGFAHGFLVLSDEAVFTYKVDNVYAPQAEAGIRWNDPEIGIQWPIDPSKVLTSDKDLRQPLFRDAELFE